LFTQNLGKRCPNRRVHVVPLAVNEQLKHGASPQ
jgi:hypothetical protein